MSAEFDASRLPMAEALQHPEQTGDYIQSQADFLLGLTQLMNTLRASQEPDRVQYNFEFLLGQIESLELPRSISLYCGNEIEDAQITLSKEAGEEPLASLELHFRRLSDNKFITLHISRDPQIMDGTDEDAVMVEGSDDVIPIDRVPKPDLNAFVLGLALGQTVYDTEALQNADLFSSLSHDTLLDALQKAAHAWQAHTQYSFNGESRLLQWSTHSSEDGEALEACRFTYETGSADHSIVVDIDPTKGLALNFWQRDADGHATLFIPDTGDILRLQDIITELVQQYDTTEVIPTDPMYFADERVVKEKDNDAYIDDDDFET